MKGTLEISEHVLTEEEVASQCAIEVLLEERGFQDHKHGTIADCPHTIGGWLLLIESELAEAKTALIKGGEGRDSVMSEIAQIGALALAAIEQHGTAPSKRNL